MQRTSSCLLFSFLLALYVAICIGQLGRIGTPNWTLYLRNGPGIQCKSFLRTAENPNGYDVEPCFKVPESVFDSWMTRSLRVEQNGTVWQIWRQDGLPFQAKDVFAVSRGLALLINMTNLGVFADVVLSMPCSVNHGPLFCDPPSNLGKTFTWMWTDWEGAGDTRKGTLTGGVNSFNADWKWYADVRPLVPPNWHLYLHNGLGVQCKSLLRYGAHPSGFQNGTCFKVNETEFDSWEVRALRVVQDDIVWYIWRQDALPFLSKDVFALESNGAPNIVIRDMLKSTFYIGELGRAMYGPLFCDPQIETYSWMWSNHFGVTDKRKGTLDINVGGELRSWSWYADVSHIVSTEWKLYLRNGPGVQCKSVLRFGENVNGYDVEPCFKVSETMFDSWMTRSLRVEQNGTVWQIWRQDGLPFKAKDVFAVSVSVGLPLLINISNRGVLTDVAYRSSCIDVGNIHGPILCDPPTNKLHTGAWMWTDYTVQKQSEKKGTLIDGVLDLSADWKWYADISGPPQPRGRSATPTIPTSPTLSNTVRHSLEVPNRTSTSSLSHSVIRTSRSFNITPSLSVEGTQSMHSVSNTTEVRHEISRKRGSAVAVVLAQTLSDVPPEAVEGSNAGSVVLGGMLSPSAGGQVARFGLVLSSVQCQYVEEEDDISWLEHPLQTRLPGDADGSLGLHSGAALLTSLFLVLVPFLSCCTVQLVLSHLAKTGSTSRVPLLVKAQTLVVANVNSMCQAYFVPSVISSSVLVAFHSSSPLLISISLLSTLIALLCSAHSFFYIVLRFQNKARLVSSSTGSSNTDRVSASKKSRYENVDQNSFYMETYQIILDGCRQPTAWYSRGYFHIELLVSCLVAFFSGIRPSAGSCSWVASLMLLCCVLHFLYLLVVRPLRSKVEMILVALISFVQVVISVLCVVLASGAESRAVDKSLGALIMLQSVSFMLETLILACCVYVRYSKRRHEQLTEGSSSCSNGAGMLNVPMVPVPTAGQGQRYNPLLNP